MDVLALLKKLWNSSGGNVYVSVEGCGSWKIERVSNGRDPITREAEIVLVCRERLKPAAQSIDDLCRLQAEHQAAPQERR